MEKLSERGEKFTAIREFLSKEKKFLVLNHF